MRTTRLPAVALLASLAFVAAACGGDDTADVPDDAPPTTVPPADEAPGPGGPGDDGDEGAERIEPMPGAVGATPVSFDPAEAEAVDGGVLLRFWGGVAPCFVLAGVDVVETDDRVTVTLTGGSDPAEPDAVCIQIALRYEVLVELDEPLGDRELLDGNAPAS